MFICASAEIPGQLGFVENGKKIYYIRAIQVLRNAFFPWNWTPTHHLVMLNNNVEPYTFVTLFPPENMTPPTPICIT